MPVCPEHPGVELTAKKKGWHCSLCDDVVLTYAEHPVAADLAPARVEASDLEDLPFPIAHPLAFARAAAPSLDTSLRLGNAIFAAYQAMRLSALLLLADYLADETIARELAGPIQKLGQPHWGEWSALLDKLCAFYRGRLADRPSRPSRFPAIVEAWPIVNATKRDARWRELLDGLPGLQGPARSANDAIWKLRNDRAHRQATQTFDRDEDARVLARTLPIVEALVQALFPPGRFTLLRRAPSRDAQGAPCAVRLHGAHEDLRFASTTLDAAFRAAFDATQVIARIGDDVVKVHPLLLPNEEVELASAPPSGLVEPLLLVDGLAKGGLVALGVRSHGVAIGALTSFRAALAQKELELGIDAKEADRWTLAGWSRWQALESVGALRGVKYFPDCYVERAGVEDVIASRLDQPGRALLVLAEAGGGKSSLLARLAERLASDDDDHDAPEGAPPAAKRARGEARALDAYFASKGRGDVVLFLSGHRDLAGDAGASSHALLCDAVVQRAGVRGRSFPTLEAFVDRLAQTADADADPDRRVWILLDAVNEADRFTDLMGALDAFLPCLGRHPWLRLVISLRSGAYHALARRNDREARHVAGVLDNDRFLHAFLPDGAKEPVPYLELPPFSASEGAAAYRLRQERLPEHASPAAFETLSPSLRAVLASPLHLHLFHETWAGRLDVPADLDDRALRDAYLDHLCARLPSMRTSLRELGEGMFERREASLPAELADAWMARWRRSLGADTLDRVLKLDPLEELVAASVLMRAGEDGGLRFTHQRLCEQVLARELLRRMAPRELPTREELLAWAQHAAGRGDRDAFDELAGALEALAEQLARAGEGATLAGLLELEDEPARTKLLGAALRALGPIWGKSEQGEPAARSCLDGLVEAAQLSTSAGERWAASSWQACRWLTIIGHSLTAASIHGARLAVRRRLVAAEPRRADLQRDLSASLNNLGILGEAAGRSEEGRRFFEESLGVLRRLVGAEPHRADLQRDLSVSLNNLGNLARAAGRSEEARRFFEESLNMRRRLAAAEPHRADLQRDLSVSLNNLGGLARAAGRSEEARRFFEESFAVMRRLVDAEPHRADLQRDLSVSLNSLGNLEEAAGRSEEARRFFEESLAAMRRLVDAEPHSADLQRELSVSLNNLGNLAQAAGRAEAARRFFEEDLDVMRRLVAAEPHRADLQHDLSVSLSNLGNLAQAAGRAEAARRFFEEDLDVMRRLVAAEPHRADLRVDLAISFWNHYRAADEPADARRHLEASLATLRPLRESGLTHAELDELWEDATEALSKL